MGHCRMGSLGAIAVVSAISAVLTGCGSLPFLSGSSPPSDPVTLQAPAATQTTAATPAPAATPARTASPLIKAALSPIVGVPPALYGQLVRQINQAADRDNIALMVDQGASGDFSVRGYIIAGRNKSKIIVTYIFDIADSAGRPARQVKGEETTEAGANAADPWAAVTPVMTQSIAEKLVAALNSVRAGSPNGQITNAQR